MAFGTIDDKLWQHDKFMVPGGDAALGVLIKAISYSNDKGTDGFISTAVAKMLSANTPAAIKTLREVTGSLEPKQGGYMIHNFGKDGRSLPASHWAALREERAAAGRLGGLANTASGGLAKAREVLAANRAATKQVLSDSPSTGLSTRLEKATKQTKPVTPVPPVVLTDSLHESPPSASARDGVVERVFATWQNQRRPGAKLTPERRRVIKARLKHYSEDDLTDALAGVVLDPYFMGQNDQGKVYDDLGLILRDAAHVEKFIALARGETPTLPTNETDRRVLALLHSAAADDGDDPFNLHRLPVGDANKEIRT